jgi:hypothetical protein
MCESISWRHTRRILKAEDLFCDSECGQYILNHGQDCNSTSTLSNTDDENEHSENLVLILLILFASIPSFKKIFNLVLAIAKYKKLCNQNQLNTIPTV